MFGVSTSIGDQYGVGITDRRVDPFESVPAPRRDLEDAFRCSELTPRLGLPDFDSQVASLSPVGATIAS